jgi:23S rRNA (pseudouridine1915-N3)-methyltransferase
MRIAVEAVGRIKSGPESELSARYFDRFARSCTGLGLIFAGVGETPESRARSSAERRREEAERLLSRVPEGAVLIALDESGRSLSSEAFADLLARYRDGGARDLALAIGGPDGHGEALLVRADLRLSLGAMTFPHQLARILIAEQLYRAATILAGHPYHRS